MAAEYLQVKTEMAELRNYKVKERNLLSKKTDIWLNILSVMQKKTDIQKNGYLIEYVSGPKSVKKRNLFSKKTDIW